MNMDSAVALFPHQLDFSEEFLVPGAAASQVLLAPPGLGKGVVAMAIAHQVATADRGAHILVLAPSPLTLQFASTVAALQPPVTVDVVDRRRLRELLTLPDREGVFGSAQIAVMSIDFAKQDDVQGLLAESHWSLVVVDEAHALRGQRQRLVRRLSASADRLLLLTAIELDPELKAAIPQLSTVRWSRDVLDSQGNRLFVATSRRKHVLDYTRSEEEARFVARVTQFVDQQAVSVNVEQREFLRSVIVRALSSSPIAIQDVLIRQRVRLDTRDDENHWWDEASLESAEVQETATASFPSIWSDVDAAAADLDELISALDGLRVDTKAEALRRFVREMRDGAASGSAPIVVFTGFVSTAAYLTEILAESGMAIEVLTGSVPVAERALRLDAWKSSRGALILTDGASGGLNLTETHTVIHYELPQTREQMEQRWGRLDRVGQTETVDAYVLRDLERTLDSEEQLLLLHGFLP